MNKYELEQSNGVQPGKLWGVRLINFERCNEYRYYRTLFIIHSKAYFVLKSRLSFIKNVELIINVSN